MAIVIDSVVRSNGMPSAPQRMQKLTVSPDASYPTGGYDVTSSLAGGTVIWSETAPHYDGMSLLWFKVNAATSKLQVFIDTGGAPGVEVSAAVDLSDHDEVEVSVLTE